MFEGGVRVVAFVGGGFVPPSVRGSTASGYVHACDWYHTLIKLAGGVPADDQEGMPPIDSLDMWPYLSGTAARSPRTQMMLSSEPTGSSSGKLPPDNDWNGALIDQQYKLVLGRQTYGFWMSPNYPNTTTNHSAETPFDCGVGGCLFDILNDPSEYVDLAKSMPEKLAQMHSLFATLNSTSFEAPRIGTVAADCEAYVNSHGGFLGPYMQGSGVRASAPVGLVEEVDDELIALEALDCREKALTVGVGTSIAGYAFHDVSTAKACCKLCNDDSACGHFVFRHTAPVALDDPERLDADAPCHLKHGSAANKTIQCSECVASGDGLGPLPPSPPPYPPPTPAPKGMPNLLLLFPDEWRYDWAGFEYPHTSTSETHIPLKLPVTAGLAARGTRFTQAYVPAPVCAPSRSCLAAAREYDFAGVPSNFANDCTLAPTTSCIAGRVA